MRFTKDATQRPGKCFFMPQIGSNHEQGFIESDCLISDWDTPYISVVALQEIAKQFPQAGLSPRSELIVTLAENEALKAENEDLREQMAAYDKELDAISVLKARGYTPAKKPGRKPAVAKS